MDSGTIVIGIPTWCEAQTIRSLVERIDEAVSIWNPGRPVVIVNADNTSPDATVQEFLAARTTHPKVSLLTDQRGKGHNIRRLFRYTLEHRASAFITIDGDLEVFPDDWLPLLAEPILSGRAHCAVPLYPRLWYDGNMTNQLVAPLVLAATGQPIRQPIGGEFAFSPSAVEFLLQQEWPSGAFYFGIDIFFVLRCIGHNLLPDQVPLSTGKIHSWRSNNPDEVEEEMELKFRPIIGTLISEIVRHPWSIPTPVPRFPAPPPLGVQPKAYHFDHIIAAARRSYMLQRNSNAWRELGGPHEVTHDLPDLPDRLWVRILANLWRLGSQNRLGLEHYQNLRTLFFLRLASVLPQLSDETVEPMVQRLADLLAAELVNAN